MSAEASGQGARIGVAAVFVGLGPPLAGAGVTLLMLAPAIAEMPEVAFMAVFGLLFGYIIGMPAALITGIAAAWLSPRLRSGALWVLICTAIGGAISGAMAPFIQFGGGKLSTLEQVAMMGAGGAAAALACALACLMFRPRPA